jgi:hypothetical protein
MYYLGSNDHYLNIVIVNSIHTILVANCVALVAFNYINPKVVEKIFLLALIQPFGLASSIMWRDAAGQLFAVVSIVFLLKIGSNFKGIFLIGLSLLFASLLRSVYIFTNLATFIYQGIFEFGTKKKWSSKLFLFLVVSVLCFLFNGYLFEFTKINRLVNEASPISKSSSGYLYIILKGLIGPFPWQQIFNPSTQGREYLLNDMLQATYCLVIYFFLLICVMRKSFHGFDKFEKIILFSVLLYMLTGLLSYGHISYTSVVSVLLLVVLKELSVTKFLLIWLQVILLFIFLSFLWAII